MTEQVQAGTYRVSELCEELKLFVGEAFPQLWVQGEVQRVHRSRPGHVYFELVEKGDDHDIRAKLDSVIWASDMQLVGAQMRRAGVSLEDGVELRLRGGMDLYPPQGRLQFRVDRVDPEFLLGEVERQRRETLRQLTERGLLDRNKGLALAEVPVRLALVTSVGSAAYHDFMTTLSESGWRFQVSVIDTVVQGSGAPEAVASALRRAGDLAIDAVVLIRGGGSRSDLHAFDTLPLATAIATCRRPAIVGLGHQSDVSVADQVAHTTTKTPTGAAAFLVARVDAADSVVADLIARIGSAASARIDRDGRRLAQAGLRAGRGLERVAAATRHLGDLGTRLHLAAGQRLALARAGWRQVAVRLAPAASRRMAVAANDLRQRFGELASAALRRTREANRLLDGYTRLTSELAPERLLARGFSIVRTTAGEVVRSQAQVTVGDRLTVGLTDGRLQTLVESKESEHEQ